MTDPTPAEHMVGLAVENTQLRARVDVLQAAVDEAHAALYGSQYVGGPSEKEAWRTALHALGAVATQHTGQADA